MSSLKFTQLLCFSIWCGVALGRPHLESSTRWPYGPHNRNLHSTLLRPLEDQFMPPAVEVKVNGQPLWLLVDTGSADTFVYTPESQCLIAEVQYPQSTCEFGDFYTGTYEAIKDLWFAQTYGTQQNVTGQFGRADLEVAGIEIKGQTIAFVQNASLNGFTGISGILGLAPKGVEAAYHTDVLANANATENRVTYPTVFESMYHRGKKIKEALFSLTLRPDTMTSYLTFGSTFPLAANQTFARTPLANFSYNGTQVNTNYYPIQPDGYTLNGTSYNTTYKVVVDSGTFVSRLPTDVAEAINGGFNPPATLTASTFYSTSCNASIPDFGITIGGTTFLVDKRDMLRESGGTCYTAFTRGFDVDETVFPEGFYVLGDLFLNSVTAVFNVGAGEMWFAKDEVSLTGN